MLSAERLAKSFSGPPLFSALDLRLDRGLLAVAGRNGSGKTTLLKILAGLMRPSGGRVILERDGRPLAGEARRLAVGFAGPDLSLYAELTVLLVLDEPMSGLDTEGRAMVERVVARARTRGPVVLASNDERDFLAPEKRIELSPFARREA